MSIALCCVVSQSVVREVEQLSALGFKEVTLLGQNVNSYNDTAKEGRKLAPTKDAQVSASA